VAASIVFAVLSVILSSLPEHSWAQPAIPTSICSSTGSGSVNCQGAVFVIGGGPQAEATLKRYLDRRLAAFTSHAELLDQVTKLQAKWETEELGPIRAAIVHLQEVEEAQGLANTESSEKLEQHVAIIEERFLALVGEGQQAKNESSARFKSLEQELEQLRARVTIGDPTYSASEHRLQIGAYYGNDFEHLDRRLRHVLGGEIAYRYPGHVVLAPTLRLYYGAGTVSAPITGGDPSDVAIGVISSVAMVSYGFETTLAAGYEWRVLSAWLDAGLRGETLGMESQSNALASDNTVRGLYVPLRFGGAVRVFNRLSAYLLAGVLFVPKSQPLRYELNSSGQRAKLAPQEGSSVDMSLQVGVRYAVGL
jgi:hypothetical protein